MIGEPGRNPTGRVGRRPKPTWTVVALLAAVLIGPALVFRAAAADEDPAPQPAAPHQDRAQDGPREPVDDPVPSPTPQAEKDSARVREAPVSAVPEAPRDGVLVLYFHLTYRCPDCILIETYTRDVVEMDFTKATEQGRLALRTIDLEAPENAALVEQYGVGELTLILSRREDGEEVETRVLDAVWDLAGDSITFADYVRTEIAALLETD